LEKQGTSIPREKAVPSLILKVTYALPPSIWGMETGDQGKVLSRPIFFITERLNPQIFSLTMFPFFHIYIPVGNNEE
jgi:hypothetical protein